MEGETEIDTAPLNTLFTSVLQHCPVLLPRKHISYSTSMNHNDHYDDETATAAVTLSNNRKADPDGDNSQENVHSNDVLTSERTHRRHHSRDRKHRRRSSSSSSSSSVSSSYSDTKRAQRKSRDGSSSCDRHDRDHQKNSKSHHRTESSSKKHARRRRRRRHRSEEDGQEDEVIHDDHNSDSDDDDTDDSYDRQRRERRREGKKKSHDKKKKKEKKRKDGSDDKKAKKKKKHDIVASISTPTFGQYGILKASDMGKMQRSFEIWLSEVRGVHLSTSNVPKYELQEYFESYREDYNTATLPHVKYYNYDQWELDEHNNKRQQGGDSRSATVGDDERHHAQELQRLARHKEQAAVQFVAATMNSTKIANMQHQLQLQAQMQVAYKMGDMVTYRKLKEKLQPPDK
jgi:hypothetical protein